MVIFRELQELVVKSFPCHDLSSDQLAVIAEHVKVHIRSLKGANLTESLSIIMSGRAPCFIKNAHHALLLHINSPLSSNRAKDFDAALPMCLTGTYHRSW
jgi:hypothetical protein